MHNPTQVDRIVGNNIRKRRQALGMTMEELGAKLREPVSSQQISKYELGDNQVGPNMLVYISDALKCHITDLLEGVKEMTAHIAKSHRADMAAMRDYQQLPVDVQESLRVLMKAMTIALGAKLKTVEGRNA